jgi:hypothetical protein
LEGNVIVDCGVIETGTGREIGAEPEALPRAASTKKAKAILATEADIAAIVGGVEVLVIENSAGRRAAIQVVVLVDAAYIGTDEQIVGAKHIGPHLDGVPPPKLRFERAAPMIDVAVGMGEKRRSIGDEAGGGIDDNTAAPCSFCNRCRRDWTKSP